MALLLFGVTFTLLPLIKGSVSQRRRKWAESGRAIPTAIEVLTLLISKTSKLFIFTLAIALASTELDFPKDIGRYIRIAIVLTFWFQVGLWGMAAVRFAVSRRAKSGTGIDPALASSIDIILFVAGLVIWAMAFLLALDKPFTIGDALQVDDVNGTVEHIGVKSTRIRSLTGEQIIMSNADILKSRVRNNSRIRERRASFMLNVAYGTPSEKLRAIPGMVREIVTAQPNTRFDRCHFMQYGDFALRFEVVFIVTVAEYAVYADTLQTVNLAILERFEQMGIELAFPARPFDPALFPKPRT
jgi:small-conductance mechanosensitive channel